MGVRQESGGGNRTRTDDPLLAKQVLFQLSYTPTLERETIAEYTGAAGLRPRRFVPGVFSLAATDYARPGLSGAAAFQPPQSGEGLGKEERKRGDRNVPPPVTRRRCGGG